jgi:TPR repeat protein
MQLFEESCRCRDAEACFYVGVANARGWGVPKDLERARPHYAAACELGLSAACFNLGIMHELGEGIPVNRSVSTDLFRQGCQLGHAGSCQNVGVALRDGAIGSPDPRGARAAFVRACELGDLYGCNDAAVLFESGSGADLDQASSLYRRACEQSTTSCINWGKFLLSKKQDVKGAHDAFQLACDDGDAEGCTLAGHGN